MKIKRIVVGSLESNCYLLEKNGSILIIDPGSEDDKIISEIGSNKPVGIIITHHHFDHDGVSDIISRKYHIDIYDNNNLLEGINKIGLFSFEVIKTPGHKEDAITIYFKSDNVMFTGDFIFKDDIGRCDLPGGSISKMRESLEKIKKYDEGVIIYPGHGEETTLGYEIMNNPYF